MGQSFINQIYEAVTSSLVWKSTVFVINYDEWAGSSTTWRRRPPRTPPSPTACAASGCPLRDNGHDYPCVNQASRASAHADIDSFLSTWVPNITGSPAFKRDGLLVITFDESDGSQSDSTACCGEGPAPNTPLPGITGLGLGRLGYAAAAPAVFGSDVFTR